MTISIPANFSIFNNASSKNLIIAVEIEGLNDVLASGPVGQKLRYGVGHVYGGAGLVYGGIVPYTTTAGGVVQQLISTQNSALNISQTCEPEQGRSSVSQMQISFLDIGGYMTKLCSPGVVLPDILGRNVKVYLGFKEISFPEDYLLVFRGVIQSVQTLPGLYTFSIGDPNVKRRQTLFYMAGSQLTSSITSATTIIPVVSTANFHTPITDGLGNVDPNIICALLIDDEIMTYTLPNQVGATDFVVSRGALGTTAAAHSAGATVTAALMVGVPPTFFNVNTGSTVNLNGQGFNPMTLALKLMLSGWDGPWLTGVALSGLGYGSGTAVSNGIFLPTAVDAVRDYGLTAGDFITISGDTFSGNNVQVTVTGFQTLNNYPNNIILTNTTFTTSPNTPGVAAFRSQYDTLPKTCGMGMSPDQVDVAQHTFLQSTFYNSLSDNLSFYLTAVESDGKQFIETEVYLPIAAYSVTAQGQCSVSAVLPPLAGQTLQNLNYTNILSPESIMQTRDVSNRNFFNEIDWQYDDDGTGTFDTFYAFVDTTTLGTIGISSVLPISSRGIHSSMTSQTVIQERSQRFLGRYAGAASLVTLKTTFGAANVINPGSIVLLTDNNTLKIPNFANGNQYLGQALYEVRNWALDIKSGQGTIQLLSSQGFNVTDRFGVWAPSSFCAATGNTTTSVIITPSFGALYGANEYLKWTSYIGATLVFHNYTWSVSSTAVLLAVSAGNILTLSTPLSFTPDNTTIVDFASYPATGEAMVKLIHCFFDRSAPITVANTSTSFTVSTADAAYFIVGNPITVHTPTWSNATFPVSGTQIDATITAVNTGTGVISISYTNSTGYTPAVGDLCEILTFADKGLGYRFV